MDNRVALIGIIVEDTDATNRVNAILHEYSNFIVGRMGVPYRDRNICIISVIVDAPNDTISSISGKLGMIKGIQAKTMYSKTAL